MKKYINAKEDLNMFGGAHATNYAEAEKAMESGLDLRVTRRAYDGQRYNVSKFIVTDLHMIGDDIIGHIKNDAWDTVEVWKATRELCEYARTGEL